MVLLLVRSMALELVHNMALAGNAFLASRGTRPLSHVAFEVASFRKDRDRPKQVAF